MSPLVFLIGIILVAVCLVVMAIILYVCTRNLEEVSSNLSGEANRMHRSNNITLEALTDVNRVTAEMMSQELAGFPCTMLPDGSGYIPEDFTFRTGANFTGKTGWFTAKGFVPDETPTEEFDAVNLPSAGITAVTDCHCRGMVPHDVRDHSRADFK